MAGGFLELGQPCFGPPVACAQDRLAHAREQLFGLIYHAGNAVLLEGVDPLHAFVLQGINAKCRKVQGRGREAVEQGCDKARVIAVCSKGCASARQYCSQNFARQDRAAGNFAFVVFRLGQQSVAQ